MKYEVIRPNTSIKLGKETYKSGDEFEAKPEDVKNLLDNKYIRRIKDGKSTNS